MKLFSMKTGAALSTSALALALMAPAAYAGCNYGDPCDDDYGNGDTVQMDPYDPSKYDVDTPDLTGDIYGAAGDFLIKQEFTGVGFAVAEGEDTGTVVMIDRTFTDVAFVEATPDGVDWGMAMFSTSTQQAAGFAADPNLATVQVGAASEEFGWGGVQIEQGSGTQCPSGCPDNQ